MATQAARDIARPKIFRVGDDDFYVESSSPERKFCYRVVYNDEEQTCTCGDYTTTVKKGPKYQCEHILAVINSDGDALDFERSKPKLDDRFIQDIKGRQFVVYAGVLDLAHQKGLKAIQVEAIQYPTNDNGMEAICRATVECEDGATFVEWGDANPKNVSSIVVRHILRVAATRAKARALRDYTNVGITCIDELDDLDDVIPETKPKNPPLKFEKPAGKVPPKKPPVEPPKQEPKDNPESPKENPDATPSKEEPTEGDPKEAKPKDSKEKFTAKLSSAQLKAIENLAKRRGMTPGELAELALETFGRKTLDALTQVQASSIIRALQQSA